MSLLRLSAIPTLESLFASGSAKTPSASSLAPAIFPFCGKLSLIQGDITKLEVDAIVNAANESLLGGGGVDGAIHRAAGPELLKACRPLGGCKTGDAKTTPGFNLPANHVIHTVGPVFSSRGPQESEKLLGSAYTKSLDEAAKVGAKSIAFPSISTGVYGYPFDLACSHALAAVGEWLETSSNSQKVSLSDRTELACLLTEFVLGVDRSTASLCAVFLPKTMSSTWRSLRNTFRRRICTISTQNRHRKIMVVKRCISAKHDDGVNASTDRGFAD